MPRRSRAIKKDIVWDKKKDYARLRSFQELRRGEGGCRITAIMVPSQGTDGGPTPLTRS